MPVGKPVRVPTFRVHTVAGQQPRVEPIGLMIADPTGQPIPDLHKKTEDEDAGGLPSR